MCLGPRTTTFQSGNQSSLVGLSETLAFREGLRNFIIDILFKYLFSRAHLSVSGGGSAEKLLLVYILGVILGLGLVGL